MNSYIRILIFSAAAALSLVDSAMAKSTTTSTCSTTFLNKLKLPSALSGFSVTISVATDITASGITYCEVEGTLTGPTNVQDRFEFALPASFNGDFLMEAEGAFAGADPAAAIDLSPLSQGYAIGITDTGHNSTATGIGAVFALNAAQLTEYLYAGVHNVTVLGQALVPYYYSSTLKYSYFNSCSNGGRAGLMEAERYPSDFSGIAVGDPALTFRDLLEQFKVEYALLGLPASKSQTTPGAGYIPAADLKTIDKAIYAQCQNLLGTGTANGTNYPYYLIQNPQACAFDPQNPKIPTGLTSAQVTTLKSLFQSLGVTNVPSTYPIPAGQEPFAMGYSVSDLGEGPYSTIPAPQDCGFSLGNGLLIDVEGSCTYPGSLTGTGAIFDTVLPDPKLAEPWPTAIPTSSAQPLDWFLADQAYKYIVKQSASADSTLISLGSNGLDFRP